VLRKLGRPEEADALCREVIAEATPRAEGDAEMLELLGWCRYRVGLYEEAEDPILLEDMDIRTDVKIVSVPYEVTLKLAEWLDNVYTKSGNPESLVLEAAIMQLRPTAPYLRPTPEA
jgi:hypothetical protein